MADVAGSPVALLCRGLGCADLGNQSTMEDGPGDTLSPSESTDSDELRNDDGDTVVDPPEGWSEADKFGLTASEAKQGESLDARVAAEEPEIPESPATVDDDTGGPVHRGQINGTPEDGDSLFEVVDD